MGRGLKNFKGREEMAEGYKKDFEEIELCLKREKGEEEK